MTRLAVTGGRFFGEYRPEKSHEDAQAEQRLVMRRLDEFLSEYPVEVLLHGECLIDGKRSGADRWANYWAVMRGVPVEAYPVDHEQDGPWPGAGPRRSARMLRKGRATDLMVFPGDKGTRACVRAARVLGLKVWEE